MAYNSSIDPQYVKWNNLIGSYFFDKEASQKVFLYITKVQLINHYRRSYKDLQSPVEIWESFISAIRNELNKFQERDGAGLSGNNMFMKLTKRLEHFSHHDQNGNMRSKYPLYLPLLVTLVLAKAETPAKNTDADIRKCISEFLKENKLRCIDEKDILQDLCYSGANLDGGYWRKLREWSIQFNRGQFEFIFSNRGQKYVNVIRNQCLISKDTYENLPRFLEAARLNYTTDYPLQAIRRKILELKKRNFFSKPLIEVVESDDNWEPVLSVISHYMKYEWDGIVEDTTSIGKRIRKEVIPCFRCVEISDDGKMSVGYRLRSDEFDTIQTEKGNKEILYGWSAPMSEFPKDTAKFRFNLEEHECNILVQAFSETGFFCATVKEVYPGEKLLLLGNKHEVPFAGAVPLPEYSAGEWTLYSYIVPANLEEIPDSLKDFGGTETQAPISLVDGAKVKNGFLNTILPKILDPLDHSLELKDSDGRTINIKRQEGLESGIWVIENHLHAGSYTIVDLEDDSRLLKFDIVRSESCEFLDKVLLDPYGNIVNEFAGAKEYFCQNQIFGFEKLDEMTYPNHEHWQKQEDYYLCQTEDVKIRHSATDFVFTFGDYLIDWLYAAGKVSRKTFVQTFYAFQKAYYVENPDSWRNVEIKINSIIKWLQYQGYIDLDRNGNLIACKPVFVCLPVDISHCNVVHLVGCRSLEMVDKIRQIAEKDDNCSFQYHQVSDQYMKLRLTPSSLYMEVKGKANNNFGLKQLCDKYCRPLMIGTPDINFIRKIREFIPSIDDLQNRIVWLPYKDSDFDYYDYSSAWKFSIGDYSYSEECSSKTLIESVDSTSFIKIKATVYNYRFIIVQKDVDGTLSYCEIEDENLGKYFTIFLQKSKNGRIPISDPCINPIKNGDAIISYGIMKKTHLPVMWEKMMNLLTTEIPSLCSTIYRTKECPFREKPVVSGNATIIRPITCSHSSVERCPCRYYLYKADDKLFNKHMLKTMFRDKLKFECLDHYQIK